MEDSHTWVTIKLLLCIGIIILLGVTSIVIALAKSYPSKRMHITRRDLIKAYKDALFFNKQLLPIIL